MCEKYSSAVYQIRKLQNTTRKDLENLSVVELLDMLRKKFELTYEHIIDDSKAPAEQPSEASNDEIVRLYANATDGRERLTPQNILWKSR